MMDEAERKILEMVENGDITAEEGLRLINAAGGQQDASVNEIDQGVASTESEIEIVAADPDDVGTPNPIPEEEQQRMNRLKRWWVLPFGIGLLITTLGAVWMYTGYEARGFGWGFWLAGLLFMLGVMVLVVSYRTSRSVWLHVRIRQKPGESPQRIAFSLPIPVALTRWIFTSFGDRIPGIKDQPIDQVSEILKNLSPEEPFYVHVNEGDGEEVEVFIG